MKKKIILIVIMAIVAILWMIFIYKMSSMNSGNSNGKSTDIIGIFIEDTLEITNEYGITDSHPNESKIDKASRLLNAPLRKVVHASVYFVLTFFMMIVLNIMFEHKRYFISIGIALALAICFASMDEYHQTFVPGRTGQIMDVIIDSIGAILAILFYSTYQIMYQLGYRKAKKEEINE